MSGLLLKQFTIDKKMSIDEQEFRSLARKHKDTIYSVCLMFADCQDDANDLMQDVLIKLWKGRGTYRGSGEEKAWVWRVAMNTCITQTGKRRRYTTDVPVGDLLGKETESEDSKQIKMLHDRIHRLKPFDRAIVMLWLEDLSYEDIGKIVGISTKNVSVRLVRIREELKKMNDNL